MQNDDAHDALKHIYNACNPALAASAEYYLDLSEVRGGGTLARRFIRELTLTNEPSMSKGFLHFLFSGHIGCGKSSELEHLRRTLEDGEGDCPRHLPVFLDADDYLDRYDVSTSDILLAIVAELADTLRLRTGIELKDNYFRKRFAEIKNFLLADAEVEDVELPLWKAKAKLKLLSKDPEARKTVRDAVIPHAASLLSEINRLFDDARLRLKQRKHPAGERPFEGIVLILDNLEKIQRITGYNDGEESVRELFIERAPQLTGLNIHTILTVPLRLVRSHGTVLANTYGKDPFVLPMAKVINRDRVTYYEQGREYLGKLLQKRVGQTSLADGLAPVALEWLLTYSGGHTRSLMAFVQQACVETERLPISLSAAKKAISETIALFSTSIPDAFWPKLAALERSPDQHIDNNDPDYREMLEKLFVLEYRNGGDEHDVFQDDSPWYAVHPIVRELSPFKRALAELPERPNQ